MKKILCPALLCSAMIGVNVAEAATVSHVYNGDIATNKEIDVINFTLTKDVTNVRAWTDSYQMGVNFDPILALWNGATGALIAQNDDDYAIEPATQTVFDSGFTLSALAAGDYFLTVAAFANFANGNNYSNGFAFDLDAPIPLAVFCQKFGSCGPGADWQVHLEYVEPNAVPVPAAAWLFGSGLLGLLGLNRKRGQALAA